MTRHMIVLFSLTIAAALAARAQPTPAAAAVACPETIAVTESAAPPNGWEAIGAKVEHQFDRVSIFNGKSGGQEYDQAPDDEKATGRKVVQTWVLKDYRSMNLFARCRYHDTPVTLNKDLPAPLALCTLAFEILKDGTITGISTAVCH